MDKLKGTKTEANLKAAFAGESQARGKYHYFAVKAREEGYDAIARYFDETAINEQEHAKIWYKHLFGINSTKENLQVAIEGEHEENTYMYPTFAKEARDEGFEGIAVQFEQIAGIEEMHEEQFKQFLSSIDTMKKVISNRWKCQNCGHVVEAKEAPNICPVCTHADIPWSGYKAFKLWVEL
ncbi:MAG: rubrerythrin family protein [Oscillospiraceae bacterium]|nr:rubrerythrin family protein [Oscillospiraceae bacterium]